jgi:antitoxin component HigA of HigAB toxin-antitoxin module
MKTTAKIEFGDLPKDYRGLCKLHMPRPIHDQEDLQNVTEIADAMAGHDLNADQEDYFDLLSGLIENYEGEHLRPSAKASGIGALKHLLEAHGMNATGLSRLLGSHRTLGAMILRCDRELTLTHVRKLAKHFAVSADLFLPN